MKVSACICVYNETTLLKAALKQYPEWVDRIIVLVSQMPWRGSGTADAFKTIELLRGWKDKRVEMVVNNWRNEEDQRNFGLGILADNDWVITMDADEYFTKEGWDELHDSMREWGACDVIVAGMRTYWKSADYRWEPPDMHKPTIAVRPKRTSFFDKREVTANLNRQMRSTMHHFSWVRTDEEVFQKVQNYMHADDFQGMEWYGNIWKAWSEDKAKEMTNLRPYGDTTTKAIYDPAPQEIKDLFQ